MPSVVTHSKVEVRVTRWRGGSHPTHAAIVAQLEKIGIRPYTWQQTPNFRFPLRSQGFHKVMCCVEGSLEVLMPDLDQRVLLRPGDRLDIPRGTRHAVIVGPRGARCVEGEQAAAAV